MEGFSSSIQLSNLDYISPAQVCVKPPTQAHSSSSGVFVHGRGDEPPPEIVRITLQDCLACSGCVTTAETVLVESQSKKEVLRLLAEDPSRIVIVTISDPSAASIAARIGCDARETLRVISAFARQHMRATAVFDLAWAQRISTDETAREYVRRLRAKDNLPMIISACPGWVCYAEKTHPELLPLMCPVGSPQSIAGAVLKRLFPGALHVSVQPCFDRKLEAVRESGLPAEGESAPPRETDCVLATQELYEWMCEAQAEDCAGGEGDCYQPEENTSGSPKEGEKNPVHIFNAAAASRAYLDNVPTQLLDREALLSKDVAALAGSGAYHQCCLALAAKELGGWGEERGQGGAEPFSWPCIRYESRRNDNYRIITVQPPLEHGGDACLAYGFQNLQNIVRQLKRKRTSTLGDCTLIEVMACPDGCLNGGGQIRERAPDTPGNVLLPRTQNRFVEGQIIVTTQRAEGGSSKSEKRRDGDENTWQDLYARAEQAGWLEERDELGRLTWALMNFKDRKAEFEKSSNIVQSLKW